MALFRSKNGIERAMFVVLALFPHMKRRYLLREAFPKPPYQLQLLCAKLLFQHKKRRLLSILDGFLASDTILYVIPN